MHSCGSPTTTLPRSTRPRGATPIGVDALARPQVRFLVAREDGRAVGCAALLLGPDGTAELKRMIVHQGARGKGIGRTLLTAIERAACLEGVTLLMLETGPLNAAALALYKRHGYTERGPFGIYEAGPWSVFMEKPL